MRRLKRKPTAVLLVNRYGGLGLHSLLNIVRQFPGYFHQVVFVAVAVIDSGTRTIVYVVKDGDTFEPRDVRLGVRASGYDEVLSGLSEGETVIVSGNFLVDSESRLKGASGN